MVIIIMDLEIYITTIGITIIGIATIVDMVEDLVIIISMLEII